MKFTIETVIHKSPEEIATAIEKSSGIEKWYRGLLYYKHKQGEPGKEGSTANLKIKRFGEEIELIETVTESNFPNSYEKVFETEDFKIYISIKLKIFPIDNYKTKVAASAYYKFSGRAKWIALFFPFLIKRNLLKIAQNFKEFIEDTKL